jgi:ABC-2 type transport system permease protein
MVTVVGLFALIGGAQGYLSATSGASDELAATLPLALLGAMLLLVPIVALGLSYEGVAGPRSSGSLQFLLGLPYSRRDYFVGTYLGRATIMAAGVAAGFVGLALGAGLRGVLVSPTRTVLGLVLAATFGVVFVAIGMSISAVVRSTSTAGALAFGAFVVLFFFWSSIPGALAFIANGFSAPETMPGWVPYVRSLSPVAAFQGVLDLIAGPNVSLGSLVGRGVDSPAFSVAVLVGWLTLVPFAAYRRFRDADL